MKPNPRAVVVIPVYNENGKIGRLIRGFQRGCVDEICVVVDSPTQAILNEIERGSHQTDVPVNLVLNRERKGVGYAIREGIQHAIQGGFDVVVVMAGNGKDDPREIPRLLKPIVEDGCDYVQGSRFISGGRSVRNPFLRWVFSRLYPLIWTLLTDIRCTDVTNGFRAYKTGIFNDCSINIWQSWLDGYGLEYYLHYKVLTLRYKTREVPVSKTYPYRHKGGYSKIFPFRDWWQIVGPLVYLKLGVRT